MQMTKPLTKFKKALAELCHTLRQACNMVKRIYLHYLPNIGMKYLW